MPDCLIHELTGRSSLQDSRGVLGRPPLSSRSASVSADWLSMELEDGSSLGYFLRRTVDIDPVDDSNEGATERDSPNARTEGVAKEFNALFRVKLASYDFFLPAAHGDGRAAGSPQVAHPLGLPPRGTRPSACPRPK